MKKLHQGVQRKVIHSNIREYGKCRRTSEYKTEENNVEMPCFFVSEKYEIGTKMIFEKIDLFFELLERK